jgi:DNA-binding NarL/FixJ family response regulator
VDISLASNTVLVLIRPLKAGARVYGMKQETASAMLDAIKTVLSADIYVSAQMSDRLL